MFTTNFAKYACVGDSISCNVGKYTFVARIVEDNDSNVNDFECYSKQQIKDWKSDRWFFCGIVLSCSYNGISLECNESLWGIECNLSDNNNHLLEVANELASQYDAFRARMDMIASLS